MHHRHPTRKGSTANKPKHTVARLYEAIAALPTTEYKGRPPRNFNAVAPTMKGTAMHEVMSYDPERLRQTRPPVSDYCDLMSLGSRNIDGYLADVKAAVETCGASLRILIYVGGDMYYTTRIQQDAGQWVSSDIYTHLAPKRLNSVEEWVKYAYRNMPSQSSIPPRATVAFPAYEGVGAI